MYGLPDDFDGTFLQGRELEQICFSRNQVYLHFSEQAEIMIEGSFSYEETPGFAAPVESEVPPPHSALMKLLGAVITSVRGTREGTLRLDFDNGHRLTCFDRPKYEAYQLRVGDRVIIV